MRVARRPRGRRAALGALAVALSSWSSPALAGPPETPSTGEAPNAQTPSATGGATGTTGSMPSATSGAPGTTGGAPAPADAGEASAHAMPQSDARVLVSHSHAARQDRPARRRARKRRRRRRHHHRGHKAVSGSKARARRHQRLDNTRGHRQPGKTRRQGNTGKARLHSRRHDGKVRITLAARRTGGTLWVTPVRSGASPDARDADDALGGAATSGVLGGSATPGVLGGSATPGAMLEGSAPVVLPASLTAAAAEPPRSLISIYKRAARRYRVPWRVLAAINSIETDYGRDLSVSSQGAVGWMQFMPATWRIYGDGGNPYDPHDAIFAAARLLYAAGASRDLRGAIFAYNHASWYVAAVLWRASTIAPRAHASSAGPSADGYALPLDARYMRDLGRTDDGVDVETAPDGATVYSITRGVVTAVASDPAGFGPNYPVVLATAGPLAGQYVYYGHVAASLVRPGQQVLAGQPIAIVGHTGDASDLGHGHIEIGFCDSSGDPLSHHGAQAWTPSGQAMRMVLVTLSHRFGIASS